MAWTQAGDEKVRTQTDPCILSPCLSLSEWTATGGDAILLREGYIDMDDGEGRQNTTDLNRSTLVYLRSILVDMWT